MPKLSGLKLYIPDYPDIHGKGYGSQHVIALAAVSAVADGVDDRREPCTRKPR
jgi:hypothetical protein